MTLDSVWLYSFFLIFCRASAMLLSSPLFGQGVPVQLRVMFAAVLAVATQSATQLNVPMPTDLGMMASQIGGELLMGLLIGTMMQWLLLALQMAGAFLDMQMGLSTMQLFNPAIGAATTVLGQFKFLFGLVILLLLDGHHQMLTAFWVSFRAENTLSITSPAAILDTMVPFFGKLSLLALQVAAPAAATTMIVDAAAGFVNKSIPQMQVYFLTVGIKTAAGIATIALTLPIMVVAVRHGVDHTLQTLYQLMGGA